jgi:hypothetical protein
MNLTSRVPEVQVFGSDLDHLTINTIRMPTMDAAWAANSGQPGTSMPLTPAASTRAQPAAWPTAGALVRKRLCGEDFAG